LDKLLQDAYFFGLLGHWGFKKIATRIELPHGLNCHTD